MNNKVKKLMSLLMVMAVMVSLLPKMTAFAAESKKSSMSLSGT